MQKLELLSPAKNYETAICAINSGADAIYIGAPLFGARKSASNSIEDIKKIVDYAHIFNVKIYVTLNTILNDEELEQAKKMIWDLYDIKIDGLIIQDFGILNLSLNNELPPIPLHASTQCDIRNIDKVKFFDEIGLKRVVLARELPLKTIEAIHKNTDIELEYFIHGALCVAYSGICYLSEYIGLANESEYMKDGSRCAKNNDSIRCANKGSCAQPCRKKYSLVDNRGNYIAKNQYLLSLKDNNLSKHLDKLIKAGVSSFKIEGRLKDSAYVKNNTLFYHNLLKNYPRLSHGKIIADFAPNPYKTFNRGFCDDYLSDKKDSIYNFLSQKSLGEYLGSVISSNDNSFIIDTKIAINPQDGLCFISNNELVGCLVNTSQKVKEGYKITPNKKIQIKKGAKIYRNNDVEFNKILDNSRTTRKLEAEFDIYDNKIILKDEFSRSAEISYSFEENAKDINKMKDSFKKALSKTQDTPFEIKKINFKFEDGSKIGFLPISSINELRRKATDELIKKILLNYKPKKQKPVDIAQFPLTEGDYRLNVRNKKAKEFYEACNCKVKQNCFETLKNHSGLELMRTKHCLKRALVGCNVNKKLFLQDEKGKNFPLQFDCKNCEMVILAP